MLSRIISLPQNSSFFLFGPRQTGKSTLINNYYNTNIWKVNLLFSDNYFTYSKDPSRFRKEAESKIKTGSIQTIFIDEIQRIPLLLNEVHFLIENYSEIQFILTGSSTRKLKKGGVNLLAGRAVERKLFPFIYDEIKNNFSLEDMLTYGSLPPLLNKTDEEKRDILNTYVNIYLKEEIQAEGIARNIGGFYRFLDVAALQFSELVNYSAIARECALPTRSVQSYYEILEDTLIGIRLDPWRKSIRKRLSAHPKFYFFDCGVVNAINKTLLAGLPGILKGKLFEQFIVLETYRQFHYRRSEASIFYWRTNHGAEVDLIIEKHGKIIAAIEIKSSSKISSAHLSGLMAFNEENNHVPLYVVADVAHTYKIKNVEILPWKDYLSLLKNLLL